MKLHITLITLSASLLLGGTAFQTFAQSEDYTMRVSLKSGGDETIFAITDVDRITFVDDNVIVKTATGDTSIAIADIDKIKFDAQISAVDNIKVDLDESINIEANGGIVNISSALGEAINVAVYNLQGKVLLMRTYADGATLDLTGYTPGVYIIKANNKVIKYKK